MTPQCQTATCPDTATVLLQSKKTGSEIHLCHDCAARYHEQGWTLIRGSVELRTADGD